MAMTERMEKLYEAIEKQIAHGPYGSEPIYGDGHAGEHHARRAGLYR